MWPFKKKTQESSNAVKAGFVYLSTSGVFYLINRRGEKFDSFGENAYIGFVFSTGSFNLNSFERHYFSREGVHLNFQGSLRGVPNFLDLDTGIPYVAYKEIASTIINQSLKQEPMQMTFSIKPHLELVAEINDRINAFNFTLGDFYGFAGSPLTKTILFSFSEIMAKSQQLERMLRSVSEASPALELEVGKVYENARGDRILITLFDIKDHTFKGLILCQKNEYDVYWFNSNGTISIVNGIKDFGDIVKISKNQSREIIL